MLRTLNALLIVLLVAAMALVRPVAAGTGTLALMPEDAFGAPLSDTELSGYRGGFNGLAFSVFFTGFFDNLGNVAGSLVTNTGGTTSAPPPTFSNQNGQVQIQTVIGNFQGAQGIFQIAQVPGSFNIVNNNLFIQIAIINVGSGLQLPSLMSLLGPR